MQYKTIKKYFERLDSHIPGYLGRETQIDVLLRKNPLPSHEAGLGAAGAAGARGGEEVPTWHHQEVLRVWPACE